MFCLFNAKRLQKVTVAKQKVILYNQCLWSIGLPRICVLAAFNHINK